MKTVRKVMRSCTEMLQLLYESSAMRVNVGQSTHLNEIIHRAR